MKLPSCVTYRIQDKLTFSGVLTIVFIALKVTNCIDWPWLYVLIPTWGKWVVEFMIGIFIDMFNEDGEP